MLKNIFLRNYKLHAQGLLVFIGLGVWILGFYPKGQAVMFASKFHNATLDAIVFACTHLGDAPVLIPALIVLYFLLPLKKKDKWPVFYKIVVGVLALAAVVAVLKQWVFNWDRPFLFFQAQGIELKPVRGMRMHKHFSFPSGHSATGFFAWYLWFHLLLEHKRWRHLWIIPALLVAFSRVYLGQHFLQDAWFGALIGYVLGSLTLNWIRSSIDLKRRRLEIEPYG